MPYRKVSCTAVIHWNKYNYYVTIKALKKEVSVMQHITPVPIGVEFYKEMITKGYY
ncbi:MAG: hypothetical protein HFH68_16350, partial [Lachnospiraceae bacterium]|nr:hypothetical protein [Lachnospiraceae bacterium]